MPYQTRPPERAMASHQYRMPAGPAGPIINLGA